MLIKDLFKTKQTTISFEVFPPKKDSSYDGVANAVKQISRENPDYMSVTYGAGGGTSSNTMSIASYMQRELNTTALAHLSCVSSSREEVGQLIDALLENNIRNILALRGDIPDGNEFPGAGHYKYAYQLVEEIKSRDSGVCVAGACYPEGHIECSNKDKDLDYLKAKVDSGCDFLITQMFFDNNVLYKFLYKALKKQIDVPVVAGVMPVTNSRQIERICALAGTSLTPKFKMILDKFGDNPDALRQAGVAYATNQIVDLIANGVNGIHVYTMNNPAIAKQIKENLSQIL